MNQRRKKAREKIPASPARTAGKKAGRILEDLEALKREVRIAEKVWGASGSRTGVPDSSDIYREVSHWVERMSRRFGDRPEIFGLALSEQEKNVRHLAVLCVRKLPIAKLKPYMQRRIGEFDMHSRDPVKSDFFVLNAVMEAALGGKAAFETRNIRRLYLLDAEKGKMPGEKRNAILDAKINATKLLLKSGDVESVDLMCSELDKCIGKWEGATMAGHAFESPGVLEREVEYMAELAKALFDMTYGGDRHRMDKGLKKAFFAMNWLLNNQTAEDYLLLMDPKNRSGRDYELDFERVLSGLRRILDGLESETVEKKKQ